MGKNKMIAKCCPKCDQQVAVATKSCKCGHKFFSARTRAMAGLAGAGAAAGGGSGAGTEGAAPDSGERRRTGRVRRARPHFYDSQDYQRQRRKTPKRRSVSHGSYEEDDPKGLKDGSKDSATAQRAARRRAIKLRLAASEARQSKIPPEPVLDPAILIRCTALLNEINRKMASVTWSPD